MTLKDLVYYSQNRSLLKGSDANIVAMSASISAVSTVAYWCSATELFAQLAERVMQPEVGVVCFVAVGAKFCWAVS